MTQADAKTGRPARILQVAHNHPRFHAGGTELTALALHRQALAEGMDSWFLGALDETQIVPNQGTQMIGLTPDHRESALFTSSFRRFPLEQDDHYGFLRELRDYLDWLRPDVVHIHHLLNFGLEALHVIRNTLRDVRIVLTIHDFYLICANNGQLYKHETRQRCPGPVLTECLKCFPTRNANAFAMRELNIRNALSLVDHVVSPSHFLQQTFETYLPDMPAITVIENGYLGEADGPEIPRHRDGSDIVFGYFGNISAVKGLGDLLDAADVLLARRQTGFTLHVHGAQLFEDRVLSERIEAARRSLGKHLMLFGPYQPDAMAGLLAATDCLVFPSVWWENAPLVIYEALNAGKPVVCYPHGGAPEILGRHGGGVLAARSDPGAMADAMQQVMTDPSLTALAPGRKIPGRTDTLKAYRALYSF